VSAPIAVLAFGAAALTRAIHGWPDTAERASQAVDRVASSPQVHAEAVTYVGVSAVIQLVALLVSVGLLAAVVGGNRNQQTFVRLAPFAASPLIVFAGLTGWDLVPVALLCAAVWAWTRG